MLCAAGRSLAYSLVDNGYDVWLGNVRGSLYGRDHNTLSVNNSEWWAWSWEQMALHDLPSMIEHTLKVTKAENLVYIGHSQGATMGFAGFPAMPKELAAKVRLFIALGPVGHLPQLDHPVINMLGQLTTEREWALSLGSHEALPCVLETKKLATACELSPELCAEVWYSA